MDFILGFLIFNWLVRISTHFRVFVSRSHQLQRSLLTYTTYLFYEKLRETNRDLRFQVEAFYALSARSYFFNFMCRFRWVQRVCDWLRDPWDWTLDWLFPGKTLIPLNVYLKQVQQNLRICVPAFVPFHPTPLLDSVTIEFWYILLPLERRRKQSYS